MSRPERYLIVNADDLGQSIGVNRGIIAAHERGVVTSASLMVRWPAAGAAAAYGRVHPRLGLGLHVDLGEWVYRNETWVPLYEVVPLDDARAIALEVRRQVATFRGLVGRGPSHLDSHQHVHRQEPVRSVMIEIAAERRVPLRSCSSEVRYCGDFYGQTATGVTVPEAISRARLLKIVRGLPPGVTELGCHPAESDDVDTMYRAERVGELQVLCDPEVRAAIVAWGIELCSFADLGRTRTCRSAS